jgi:hypothetical protein
LKIINIYKAITFATCALLAACGGDEGYGDRTPYTDPGTTTSWTAEQIKTEVMAGYDSRVLVRWEPPIEINTNGITRAEEALDRYESLLGGVVFFTRVNTIPENGIVFVEGGARNGDNSTGCANVNNSPEPGPNLVYTAEQVEGNLTPSKYTGLYYIHLGSSTCDDAKNGVERGPYASAIAEHELGHALGLNMHFDGFEGNDGLIHPNFFNVMYNLYANPIGANENDVSISIVEVGQFGQ